MAKDKQKNSAADSGMRGAVSPAPGRGAKKLAGGVASITVRRAANGYIASCDFPYDGGKYKEPEQNVFANAADVAEFVEQKLGVKDGDEK